MTAQPRMDESVVAYRHAAVAWSSEIRRQDLPTAGYASGNALTTAWQNMVFRTDSLADYQPRTELGKRLLALRRAYLAGGGRLFSAEALDEELRSRRGGVGDD